MLSLKLKQDGRNKTEVYSAIKASDKTQQGYSPAWPKTSNQTFIRSGPIRHSQK
jgi:hypothetical protein